MDKIIWLDGHTSSIASDEAFSKQYSENNKWYMKLILHLFGWLIVGWRFNLCPIYTNSLPEH